MEGGKVARPSDIVCIVCVQEHGLFYSLVGMVGSEYWQ